MNGEIAHLQRVFSRETLVAVTAREWLNSQVYSLVSLKIMITIKALRALVALEWAIGLRSWRRSGRSVDALHTSGMSAVEACHDSRWHTSNHYSLAVGV